MFWNFHFVIFLTASIWNQLKYGFYFHKGKLSILCPLWQYIQYNFFCHRSFLFFKKYFYLHCHLASLNEFSFSLYLHGNLDLILFCLKKNWGGNWRANWKLRGIRDKRILQIMDSSGNTWSISTSSLGFSLPIFIFPQ